MIRNSSGAHIGLAAPIEAREAMRAAFASIKPAPVRTVRHASRFPWIPAGVASGFALCVAHSAHRRRWPRRAWTKPAPRAAALSGEQTP